MARFNTLYIEPKSRTQCIDLLTHLAFRHAVNMEAMTTRLIGCNPEIKISYRGRKEIYFISDGDEQSIINYTQKSYIDNG